jgi:MFS family permease
LNVGTIIGTIATAPFAHKFGRRPAIWVASAVSLVACGVQLGATSLSSLYAGRIILGLSNGFFITFSNVYTVEATPPHLRGILVSFFGFWVNIGSILGAVVDNYSKNRTDRLSYQIPLACPFAVPVVLSVFMIFVPESPRWLLLRNRPAEARKSLERMRGGSLTEELLGEEFVEMQRGIEEEKELSSSASIKGIFKGADLRRTLLCVLAIGSHAASGI